jgi:ABC-type lipoprotein export system ATPase subunit
MLLELKNIAKRYRLPDGTDAPYVLKDINFQVDSGESVAIVGPSGSGKSTLLNIIGALDYPTAGSVFLEDRDISRLGEDELSLIRSHKIGFVFQLHHLLPQYTALENVLVPTMAITDRPSDDAENRARRLLSRVGLESRLSYRPGQLSGGERQRVAVVRSLINNPKLLLADEPTGSLDRSSSDNLMEILTELNDEENVTLIMVTHSLNLAERMKRVLELKDGMLITQKS